jgi:hypothetical protein
MKVGDLVRAWGAPRPGSMFGIIIQVSEGHYVKSPGYDYPDLLSPYLVRWGDGTTDWMREEFLEKVYVDE